MSSHAGVALPRRLGCGTTMLLSHANGGAAEVMSMLSHGGDNSVESC
jgi:hypothetical protein